MAKDNKAPQWHKEFTPSYTPLEMLDLGIFEGIYTAAIEGLPKKWYDHKNVLPKGADPQVEINRFGIKSRQSLTHWQEKGWTTKHSPLGWWQWYCLYWLGRRIEKEDEWQIGRWASYVARHQGQIDANCKKSQLTCREKQRQGLLQWGWDSTTSFTVKQRKENLRRLRGKDEVSLSVESLIQSLNW